MEPSNDHLSAAGTDGSGEHRIYGPEEEEDETVAYRVAASVPSFVKDWEFPTESSSASSRIRSCDKTVPRHGVGSSRHRESEDSEVGKMSSYSAVISSEIVSTEKNDSDGFSGKHVESTTVNRSLTAIEGKIIEKVDHVHNTDGKDLQNNWAAAKEENNMTEVQSHDLSDASSDDDSFIY